MKENYTRLIIQNTAEHDFSVDYAVNIGIIEKTTRTLDYFKESQDQPTQRTCKVHASTSAE